MFFVYRDTRMFNFSWNRLARNFVITNLHHHFRPVDPLMRRRSCGWRLLLSYAPREPAAATAFAAGAARARCRECEYSHFETPMAQNRVFVVYLRDRSWSIQNFNIGTWPHDNHSVLSWCCVKIQISHGEKCECPKAVGQKNPFLCSVVIEREKTKQHRETRPRN